MQPPATLAQAAPAANASAVARLLLVVAAVLVGLVFIRLLVSVGRFFVVATVGLLRLVISRVLLLLVALALLGVLLGTVRPTFGLWAWARPLDDPPIARQRQDGYIEGTPQYRLRLKQGKPTPRWDEPAQADPLTREAWRKGTAVPGRPGLRDWDAGRRIGADPAGGSLTHIRVSRDRQGRIYGWPAG